MKKHLLIFVLSCLAFGFSNAYAAERVKAVIAEASVVSGQKDVPLSEKMGALRGLANSSVKVNENDHPVFHNLPSKRVQSQRSSFISGITLNAYYASYARARGNSIHSSPFYIAYHRLTI